MTTPQPDPQCVCISNGLCEVHTVDDWCANPPPWSEDDVRAAFEALGDETNQDDLIFHLRHHPPITSGGMDALREALTGGALEEALFDDVRLWYRFTDLYAHLGGPTQARRATAAVAAEVVRATVSRHFATAPASAK